MSLVASRQYPKPIEVYSSSNSTLPTNISLRKKEIGGRQKSTSLPVEQRIAASKSWSIKIPQYWTAPKREMHTDMFLLVVCYASAWSCLKLFFSPLYEICRGSKRSVNWSTNTFTVYTSLTVKILILIQSQCCNRLKLGLVFSLPVDVLFCTSSFMSDCHWRPAGSSVGSRQCGAKCPGVSIAVKPH